MNELDKLKLHLNNLKNKGHLEFNINVKYLLDLLETLPTQPEAPKRSNNMDVDGGDFTDG
ncbi:hypothetical protein N9J02_00140 [bacterium]|jgi:hypothetical protein|nr:hypothetical protein [bacterium]